MSDRLALAHAIEDAGIPREKAEGMATAIARFVEGNVATKADVQASEARLRAEINATEAALHTLVAGEAAPRCRDQAACAPISSWSNTG